MGLLDPDAIISRVTRLDPQRDLFDRGITGVLLDVDNTVRMRTTGEVPWDIRAWIMRARSVGIGVCLLSNNWHVDVFDLAQELEIPIVAKACKPIPAAYLAAARKIQSPVNETVAIGDQLFTDVLGAHLAGMRGYLVRPLCEEDLRHTVWLHKVEQVILKRNNREHHPSHEPGIATRSAQDMSSQANERN